MAARASVRRFPDRCCDLLVVTVLQLCALLFPSVHDSRQVAANEVLVLQSGEALPGRSQDIHQGCLHWELLSGEVLVVPLEWIERMDAHPAEPVQQIGLLEEEPIPPSPEVVVDEENDPIEDLVEPEELPEETPWTAEVPLYSVVQQGIQVGVQGYQTVGETAETWTRRFTLGGQFNDGNSQTQSLNMQLDLEHSPPGQLRQLDLTGNLARNKNRQTTNRWILNGNFDRPLMDSERWITFATTKNEYDRLANLDYRGTLSTGLGIRIYNEPKKRLIVRFGPGFTVEVFSDPGNYRESVDMFAELEARWPIRQRASLEHKVRVNPSILDFELVRSVSTSSLLIDLDEKNRWKLRLGFNYTYNSEPAQGRLPSDYLSTVSLMYTRK